VERPRHGGARGDHHRRGTVSSGKERVNGGRTVGAGGRRRNRGCPGSAVHQRVHLARQDGVERAPESWTLDPAGPACEVPGCSAVAGRESTAVGEGLSRVCQDITSSGHNRHNDSTGQLDALGRGARHRRGVPVKAPNAFHGNTHIANRFGLRARPFHGREIRAVRNRCQRRPLFPLTPAARPRRTRESPLRNIDRAGIRPDQGVRRTARTPGAASGSPVRGSQQAHSGAH
jgi:hypothetical protein